MTNLRRTLVVPNQYALRWHRTQAALGKAQGMQIMLVEHLVGRLAGGFLKVVDGETLKQAVGQALQEEGKLADGELKTIIHLPGFRRAAAATLENMWRAGLSGAAKEGFRSGKIAETRRRAIADLEASVLTRLPRHLLSPTNLVEAALKRIGNAETLFGPIVLDGFTEMDIVWRRLLNAIAQKTSVIWRAGNREYPTWLNETGIKIETTHKDARPGSVRTVSCANPRHEILEAIRWSRGLLIKGIPPQEIGIASASPSTWDDYMLALKISSELPIHFAHGIAAMATADGQLAGALADVLLRGITASRMLRLITLLRTQTTKYKEIPYNWASSLPKNTAIMDPKSWQTAISKLDLDRFTQETNPQKLLTEIGASIGKCLSQAAEIGKDLLDGKALQFWESALQDAPPEALANSLADLRIGDGVEPCAAILWSSAAELAACPRPYTWLVGLTSQAWPRRPQEDPLLPDHIVPQKSLNPLPVHLADTRDFQSIWKMTEKEWVGSRARRNSDGRLFGISPLYPKDISEEPLTLSREAEIPANPADHWMSQSQSFNKLATSIKAKGVIVNWENRKKITAHDGLIRKGHPLLAKALERTHSATSLKLLLRDPIQYLWKYGFGWKEPNADETPLTLDPLDFGTLVHAMLQSTVTTLEETSQGGFGKANEKSIRAAIKLAVKKIQKDWEDGRPLPPLVIWTAELELAADLTANALLYPTAPLPNQRSWTEIPFGWKDPKPDDHFVQPKNPPWKIDQEVRIPGTSLTIRGSIDRLDLSGNMKKARVTDYKTGNLRKKGIQLNGGEEIQRCLYAMAVKSLIKKVDEIETYLHYPRGNEDPLLLDNPDDAMDKLAGYIKEAATGFSDGKTLAGPGAGDAFNGFLLALPAGCSNKYWPIKESIIAKTLATLAPLWDEA